MKLLITSDTHVPKRAKRLPKILLDHACRADHILHAGDLVDFQVWQQLSECAPLSAVSGNNEIGVLKDRLPESLVLRIEGVRIGLIHGHRGKGKSTLERASFAFPPGLADVVVFGHSHQPYAEWRGERLMLNPGSATDRRKQPHFTFLWLFIDKGKIDFRWVNYESID